MAVAITGKLSPPAVHQAVRQAVEARFAPGLWALLVWDDQRDALRFEMITGTGSEQLQGTWLALGSSAVCDVFRAGQMRQWKPEDGPLFVEGEPVEIANAQLLPLWHGDEPVGVLVVADAGRESDDEALAELTALADYTAIAVDNARRVQRIRELSVTDDVTSLYNARYLQQALEQEFSRSRRTRTPLSVIFLDLDYFKHVNDTHGHLVGSEVLRETANILRQSLRVTDIATRYGGDEFVLILPETSQQDAVRVAERCRQAIKAHSFGLRHGLECKVTASFGIATMPDDTSERDDIIRLADQAMYWVKEHNRDNIATVSRMREGA
ncbi:MAG: GGDEF domain-containing protein [Candidatus Dadabacteria bacterium]|nr:MAG: GGDEF domain-containing protein [Candidatus Dadabacteria bacterium]